jgi:hypothetical protein
MLIIFFSTPRATVHEEFVLAGQTVNSAYYSGVSLRLREDVRRLRTELWREKNWLLHQDNATSHTSFITTEFFYQKQHDCSPYFSLLLKIQYKCRHFDTTEVMEAEPQAVLNSLTEHGFQDAFRHGRGWERCIGTEGDCFEGEGGQ